MGSYCKPVALALSNYSKLVNIEIRMNITQLSKGDIARITDVTGTDAVVCAKLREIGFAEGDEVEIMHYGPLGRKPICVRLNHTLIALRPIEAQNIEVELLGGL